MANSNWITRNVKSSQTSFLKMTMSSLYSNGLHNHHISIQYRSFWMRMGDSYHGCTADKSAETA